MSPKRHAAKVNEHRKYRNLCAGLGGSPVRMTDALRIRERASAGPMGRVRPTARQEGDIAFGVPLLRTTCAADIVTMPSRPNVLLITADHWPAAPFTRLSSTTVTTAMSRPCGTVTAS